MFYFSSHALHRCGLLLQISHKAWPACLSQCLLGTHPCESVGRTKKKSVEDDTEAPKAPRLRRRVLHGGQQPQWGKSPVLPGNSSTGRVSCTKWRNRSRCRLHYLAKHGNTKSSSDWLNFEKAEIQHLSKKLWFSCFRVLPVVQKH